MKRFYFVDCFQSSCGMKNIEIKQTKKENEKYDLTSLIFGILGISSFDSHKFMQLKTVIC